MPHARRMSVGLFGLERTEASHMRTIVRGQNSVDSKMPGRTQFVELPAAERFAVQFTVLSLIVNVPFIASPLTVPV